MSQTTTSRTKTLENDGDVWARFWLGLVIVLAFILSSILLVVVLGGARAAADYGLSILVITLAAALADGIIIWRRNR